MTYSLVPLRGPVGVASGTAPLSYEFSLSPSEITALLCVVKVSAVSAGINASAPALLTLRQSWDDGTTWELVKNYLAEPVSAAGIFKLYATVDSGILAPLQRITLTAPAGETATIAFAKRASFSAGEGIGFSSPNPGIGFTLQGNIVKVNAVAALFDVFELYQDTVLVQQIKQTYADATKAVAVEWERI
jgi:hypothetical protein